MKPRQGDWRLTERETFKEKYLQHPKNFGMIAQYLERKSVADCVQYYYISKKTENYKQLLRKSRVRPRGGARNRQQAPPADVIAPHIPRVVTRGKAREELLPKDESNGGKGSRAGTPNNVKNEENGDSGKYDISHHISTSGVFASKLCSSDELTATFSVPDGISIQ